MYANYHTHTSLCRHADGDVKQYVENAIKAGIKILGFSDHSPYIFDGDYYSTYRMHPNETESYVNEILKLKREYKDDIKIYIGYEMEYYPKYFEKTLKFILQFECDYLILGQHFLNDEINEPYVVINTKDKGMLVDYVNQTIEGMKTGVFSCLAHPDLINYDNDLSLYKFEMSRLCQAAKMLNIPLEINMLGLKDNRNYPNKEFWEIASKTGNDVILGCDAHTPDAFLDDQAETQGKILAQEYGIKLIKALKLVKPVLKV
ncbi:MAG: histidinol-phosphatase [Clostridia bacterium]|nr:histidinol-phosphatase [Clostridia bacterium]